MQAHGGRTDETNCGHVRPVSPGRGHVPVSVRVPVQPGVLRWACERGRIQPEYLARRFPGFSAWESGTEKPTLKQLENFAKASRTPIGFFFLSEPPDERVPIPDFRTVADKPVGQPSADLLDTIYLCQQRQAWYRDNARMEGEPPLDFVGSVRRSDAIEAVADRIRATLRFNLEERSRLPSWTAALRLFIEQANNLGVLVMVSGVVGSNNRRRLDFREFRGFALVDDLAPLIFVNGADSKSAQMFTLAHELAHVWLGESALSDSEDRVIPDHRTERFCNQVAAEILAPIRVVRDEHRQAAPLQAEMSRLARRFKVSTLVVLRRLHELGALTGRQYWDAYDEELDRLRTLAAGSGGNFYSSTGARVSKRFARAVLTATLEGRSSYTDAFHLLGFRKLATFNELSRRLGLTS